MDEHGFSLSERQLRRWLVGNVSSLDGARPANVRVAEQEFGWPIEALLAPDTRPAGGSRLPLQSTMVAELGTSEFISWVASHSEIGYEDAYSLVSDAVVQIAATPQALRAAKEHARAEITRAQLADAISSYYGEPDRFYSARLGRRLVRLSVLSVDDWVGLKVGLGGDNESCPPPRSVEEPATRLTDSQARAALDRLAVVEDAGTVLVNNPLYRLCSLEIEASRLSAQFETTEFASYVLTADLLEAELRGLVSGEVPREATASTPLRDAWLPTLADGLAFEDRLCAGGPVCLVAIADGEQYQLLVQERSRQVLNVIGALSVVPKAFHQPTMDAYGETRISTTIERELEEELLGRSDLEQLSAESMRRAAPLDPLNATAPMRWLRAHPQSWQMECTGFGINMVSGNYEFSCLVAIHDPTWWSSYAHLLEANWEARRLHRYSSLDTDGIYHVFADPRWSNEGLFAFIEGLRRLSELGSPLVRVPAIERIS